MLLSRNLRPTAPCRHRPPSRDEKPVTATPLESAFTKRDARNSFRICIYENCRVSLLFPTKNLKSYLNLCFIPHSSLPCVHFSLPLFSSAYKCPLPQPLSLHILTNARGVWGSTSNFPTLFSLSAPRVFHNSFPIKVIRTLSENCRVSPDNSHSGSARTARETAPGSRPISTPPLTRAILKAQP